MATELWAERYPAEFRDQLKNYEPPPESEPLERALVEVAVGDLDISPQATCAPDTPFWMALRIMASEDVAALLVVDGKHLMGIFTKRDILMRAALEWPEVEERPIAELMTTEPDFVYETESIAAAMCVMANSGCRHVPVLHLDDTVAGLLYPLRLTEFISEFLKE
ncbi:MAG: CBS domain-containing protein [Planctomycetota bacterium]|jgi:signal-transduction protein with cAMP-binding, CBS, and nucleotidyltransferase domain|nr:CBS domain-containing protein [Planctomycetota bacterium]